MPQKCVMDYEKNQLESSLYNLFDKNIKPTLEGKVIPKNIQIINNNKEEYFHVDINYKLNRKEKVLSLLLKKTKHADYERRLYNFLCNFYKTKPLDCILKFCGQLHDNNTNERINYLAFELPANIKKFDSLEEKLIEFNDELEKNKGNEEKVSKILTKEMNLLKKVTKTIAEFNYWCTKGLLLAPDEKKGKKHYELFDEDNKEWFTIKTYDEKYHRNIFFNDIKGIYKQLNIPDKKIGEHLEDIKEIITPRDNNSIFAWSEFGPMQFLIHRNLHGRNILVLDNKIKIIDLQNMGVGSALIDLGFFQNPSYNPKDKNEERRHILHTYLTHLETLSDNDSSLIRPMVNLGRQFSLYKPDRKDRFDFYESDKQNRIREIFWGIHLAKENIGRSKTSIEKHLKYAKDSLNEVTPFSYIIQEYHCLKKLQDFLIKTTNGFFDHPNI